ncbi:MAG: helix-turn-helix transcriptional regulator [Lentisphaerae bacterium]|nr:helix-turn-helix transcriptional regulator [Lentisphaerota bacterium]
MSREAFANELNNIIQESGIRKTIIAQALGISSSALSQFIHGTAIPRPEQLNEILLLLCVSDIDCAKIHSLLNKVIEEAGDDWESQVLDWREPDNDDEEQEKYNSQSFNKFFEEPGDNEEPAVLMLAEIPESGVPVIDLYTLNNMSGNMNLYEFAMLNVHDTVIRNYGSIGSPVIIKTVGSMVGMNYPGPVQLVVSQDAPTSYSVLTLVAYTDDSYQVIFNHESRDFVNINPLFNKPRHTDRKKCKWFAPVLEFTIVPLNLENTPEKQLS